MAWSWPLPASILSEPKHNGKAQTLDKDDKPIPRLYTPGELGSFFGFLYPGGSNIPEAIAFGRIAGENAAAENDCATVT